MQQFTITASTVGGGETPSTTSPFHPKLTITKDSKSWTFTSGVAFPEESVAIQAAELWLSAIYNSATAMLFRGALELDVPAPTAQVFDEMRG